ncbi:two-component sensor histidine kinase [Acrocarpospora pleiomorpha]|uniref:histidine kinase n=1 Tax=Acrocarpospora pleiomorpha TaxID=90975 RepID=A0A5M3XI28_9ACTN|nr:two-component sensor histidine kinase [Acrocarpospora pleiomorpha]
MRAPILVLAVVAGLASEWVAYRWEQPGQWIPDLLTGLVLVGSGLYARKAPGTLLIATGFAWFAGNLDPALWYWHRGPLIHLLLMFPGWRPTTRLGWAAVGTGYVAAVVQPVWNTDLAAVALVSALLVAGGTRRATIAFALAVYGGAASRLVFPAGEVAFPAALGYQAVLCGIAITLAWTLRRPGHEAVTDQVIELARPGSLRAALAETLGDPDLRVGFWRDGRYFDERGVPIALPAGDLATTFIGDDGEPFAVIVHDRAVLTGTSMIEAVGTAARLTAVNAALQAEVRAQAAELAASRRRLMVAADEERRHLAERLQEGPVRHLTGLLDTLKPGKAAEHLANTLQELDDLAHGLHPRELHGGLVPALAALAARSPVPVRLNVSPDPLPADAPARLNTSPQPLPADIEAAVYFVCAEALANVAKHAAASTASITLTRHDAELSLSVRDDGVGGADPAQGSGLRGLSDRVETFGGRLTVDSAPGNGTRLVAEIPLGDEPR